jgi:hypothetical protein
MNKIVFIDHEPYTDSKDYKYSLTKFQKYGYNIEYWYVGKAMNYSKKCAYTISENPAFVFNFYSFTNLIDKLKELNSNTIVIIEIFFTWETIILFYILKKNKIKLFKIDYFLNTSTYFEESTPKKIIYNLLDLNILEFFKKAIRFINFKTLLIIGKYLELNRYETLFLTGTNINQFYPNQKKISINYFDVEIFQNIKHPPMPKRKFIVFLDINLTSHPDLARDNLTTISQDIYFNKLINFFNFLEKDTGFEVVVAAHPKSNYTNEFGKFRFFYNQTANLVSNSEYILLHNSASMNYALLSKKPLVFFYFDFFLNSTDFLKKILNLMETSSKYFCCHLINVDKDDLTFSNNLKFNINKYNEYLNNVIFSKEYPKSNFEIIKEAIVS